MSANFASKGATTEQLAVCEFYADTDDLEAELLARVAVATGKRGAPSLPLPSGASSVYVPRCLPSLRRIFSDGELKMGIPAKKRKIGSKEGKGKTLRPGVVEEWKWRGVPVRSHARMICTGETYNAPRA